MPISEKASRRDADGNDRHLGEDDDRANGSESEQQNVQPGIVAAKDKESFKVSMLKDSARTDDDWTNPEKRRFLKLHFLRPRQNTEPTTIVPERSEPQKTPSLSDAKFLPANSRRDNKRMSVKLHFLRSNQMSAVAGPPWGPFAEQQIEEAQPGAVAVAGSGGGIPLSYQTGTRSAGREDVPENSHDEEDGISGLAVANPVIETSNRHLPVAQAINPEIQHNNTEQSDMEKVLAGCKSFCCKGRLAVLATVLVVVLLAVFLPRDIDDNFESTTGKSELTAEEEIVRLLPEYTQEAIKTPGTPQALAARWLSKDPNVKTYPDWRIVQRFVLSTFYYATSGDGWVSNQHWLSYEVHECEWHSFSYRALLSWKKALLDWHTEGNDRNTTTFEEGIELAKHDDPCGEANNRDGQYRHFWQVSNKLTGTLPQEFFLLTSLQSILLVGDNKMHVRIVSQLGQLSGLRLFFTGLTAISGSIPSEIAKLDKLMALGVWNNRRFLSHQLAGTLPSGLVSMTNLVSLWVANSNIRGPLISEIGMMSKLTILGLDDNRITGRLPSELALLSNLELLLLSSNELRGVPSELGRMTALQEISLERNQLTVIPEELYGLVTNGSLRSLDVTGNEGLEGIVQEDVCVSGVFHFDCSETFCGCSCACPMFNGTGTHNETKHRLR